MGPRSLAPIAAAVLLAACLFDGGGGPVPGANYLAPASSLPSQAESLSFYSAIHILYNSRYRDLAEVKSLARENVPLHGLIPSDNASRVGFVAPFNYGTLALDTAWLIIDGDTGTAASGNGMVFRKNGEAALTYRLLRDSAGVDSLLWIIRETRRPCGPIYYAPEGWSPIPGRTPGGPVSTRLSLP